SRDADVCDAHERAVRLDRAKDRIREMLPQNRRFSEITVVRHLDQKIRAAQSIFARERSEMRFETDHRAAFSVAERQQIVFVAERKIADKSRNAARHKRRKRLK